MLVRDQVQFFCDELLSIGRQIRAEVSLGILLQLSQLLTKPGDVGLCC